MSDINERVRIEVLHGMSRADRNAVGNDIYHKQIDHIINDMDNVTLLEYISRAAET